MCAFFPETRYTRARRTSRALLSEQHRDALVAGMIFHRDEISVPELLLPCTRAMLEECEVHACVEDGKCETSEIQSFQTSRTGAYITRTWFRLRSTFQPCIPLPFV